MLMLDANVLLNAVNGQASQHAAARAALELALSGTESVGFAWIALLAFVRVATRPNVFPRPLAPEEAMAYCEEWLEAGPSVIVHPTHRHLAVLTGLVRETGTAGNLTSDAHLAAIAIEHGATVVSFDRDFSRFPGLRVAFPG